MGRKTQIHMWPHLIHLILALMTQKRRAVRAQRFLVKYSEHAFNKIVEHKQNPRNHLLDQVESFRIGDNHRRREEDLLDIFCYGIAMALGNSDGFQAWIQRARISGS